MIPGILSLAFRRVRMTYRVQVPYRGSPLVKWANTRKTGKGLACAAVSMLSGRIWK